MGDFRIGLVKWEEIGWKRNQRLIGDVKCLDLIPNLFAVEGSNPTGSVCR
jgi:hypothetical protein